MRRRQSTRRVPSFIRASSPHCAPASFPWSSPNVLPPPTRDLTPPSVRPSAPGSPPPAAPAWPLLPTSGAARDLPSGAMTTAAGDSRENLRLPARDGRQPYKVLYLPRGARRQRRAAIAPLPPSSPCHRESGSPSGRARGARRLRRRATAQPPSPRPTLHARRRSRYRVSRDSRLARRAGHAPTPS